MRHLYLLRGNIGSGKSTWLQQNGLEPYTLCADTIRLQLQAPVLTVDGSLAIGGENDRKVWELLFDMLEARMNRGELVFIDATHSKQSDFNKYRDLAEVYRYRLLCVDFSDVPLEQCKKQNAGRVIYKQVPESVLDNIDSRLKTQPLPGFVQRLTPYTFHDFFQLKPIDLTSKYESIVVIGDIHGCMDALSEFFVQQPFRNDYFYIFVGDYIDRGIQNVEVIKWLLANYTKENILLMEGNHEKWLRLWAIGALDEIKSNEFIYTTMKDLNGSNIDLKDVRQLCRKFAQIGYYTWHDKTLLVTHGGISRLPENLITVATEQMIKGVGKYEALPEVAKSWLVNSPPNAIQVIGHRNVTNEPVKVNERFYDLEGKIEHGGHLRVVTIGKTVITTHEIKNPTFRDRTTDPVEEINTPVFLVQLRSNRDIREKKHGEISSFNFTKKVFYDKRWNSMNVKARGLFVNTRTNEIVARSYNKFFNINERPETKIETLTFQYPVQVYTKYNGFLGMLGYDTSKDELVFCSKSSMDGAYVDIFKRIFGLQYPNLDLVKLKNYLKDTNSTMVFEVIDPKDDPHIIPYRNQMVVLLDIVIRAADYSKLPYSDLFTVASSFGLFVKTRSMTFQDHKEFIDWYNKAITDVTEKNVEGYVLEDSNGFMIKLKLPYYQHWKHMRGVKDAVKAGRQVKLSALVTPEANYFYAWLKKQTLGTLEKDIITLREMYESNQGKSGTTP